MHKKCLLFFTGLFLIPTIATAEISDALLKTDNPVAFATAASQKNGAVFLTITNESDEDRSLVKATSDVAEIVELHENLIDPDDGMMMMRKVKTIDVPSKGSTILEPTGLHIMLIKLKEPLAIESTFPVTLYFDNEETMTIDVSVVPPGSMTHDHHENYE